MGVNLLSSFETSGKYIVEVSYHPAGDRLVAADIDGNFHIFDLLLVGTDSSNSFELNWIKTSTFEDKSIDGVVCNISWASECFGQMFAVASNNKSISIWCETRQGYQDTYHSLRRNIIYLNKEKSIIDENLPMSIKNGSSWVLATSFSPFKGKILDIVFSPKENGLALAACDSKGFVGFFTCNKPNVKSGWTIEIIKVKKKGEQENNLASSSNKYEDSICSLDWAPLSSNIGPTLIVAINNEIYILNKNSKSWNCVETISIDCAGLIKNIACCPISSFTENFKLATFHSDDKLIIWKTETELSQILGIKNQAKIISQICELDNVVSIVSF